MKSIANTILRMTIAFAAIGICLSQVAVAENAFVGDWALTLPGDRVGWLGVEQSDDGLTGSLLWGGGSVLPVDSVEVQDDTLVITRITQKGGRGKTAKTETSTIRATVDSDTLNLTVETQRADGKQTKPMSFTGTRIAPLPSAPDLSEVKFAEPVSLFNGKDLDGWVPINKRRTNGWRAEKGMLVNDVHQEPGKHTAYANLRTSDKFEDFNLTLETRVPKGGNSGVYLRGIYEVQVFDSHGRSADSHNMGAIYSRVTPDESAEKPAGQWQTLDITLVDRHVTVVLNDVKIIDNQPLRGNTGGALSSDQFKPGPIYLQGDHTGIEYRNIILRPVAGN